MDYNDADDRRLAEMDDEMERDYLDCQLLLNEDIQIPLFVINGVAYYG